MEVAAASVTASRTGQCHRIKEVRVAEMDDYNAKVIEEFRGNGGVVGGQRMYLLLTTAGAKTGLRRTTPLVCQVGGDGVLYIFASKAGAPRHPDWYYNLAANPRVGVGTGRTSSTPLPRRSPAPSATISLTAKWRPSRSSASTGARPTGSSPWSSFAELKGPTAVPLTVMERGA